MELTTLLEMAKDCNAKTLGQAIKIIRDNQEMLFEYEDKKTSMQKLVIDIKRNRLDLNDNIYDCFKKIGRNKNKNNNYKWWDMVC